MGLDIVNTGSKLETHLEWKAGQLQDAMGTLIQSLIETGVGLGKFGTANPPTSKFYGSEMKLENLKETHMHAERTSQ